MSSSGRFQSHLFSFVARQTQKLVDKTTAVLRHTKVVLIWTSQILLYPAYALFQSTRLIGQQIGQTVQRSLRVTRKESFFQLTQTTKTELAADTPIQQVLNAIQLSESDKKPETEATQTHFLQRVISSIYQRADRFKPQSSSLLTPHSSLLTSPLPCPIQGIASLIPTGKLVLVTIENQIMDILTIEQQEDLRRRIVWEMAVYWRYCRQRQLNPIASLAIVDRPNSLAPVRVLHQLMGWVQRSPVAIAANLFQESALVEQPSELAWFSPEVSLTFHVDSISLKVPTQSDFKTLARQLPTLSDVEALIWAAVHYFSRQRHPIAPGSSDQWLTSSEVFGASPALREKTLPGDRSLAGDSKRSEVQIDRSFQPVAAQEIQPDESATVLPFQPVQVGNLQSWVDRLAPKKPRSNLAKTKSAQLISTAKPEEVARRLDTAVVKKPSSKATLQPPAHWIEAKATPVGYVKSPLEQLIGWLDKRMAAIEQMLITFWGWLAHRR